MLLLLLDMTAGLMDGRLKLLWLIVFSNNANTRWGSNQSSYFSSITVFIYFSSFNLLLIIRRLCIQFEPLLIVSGLAVRLGDHKSRRPECDNVCRA